MIKTKIINAISMSRGAGKLVMGFDAVKASVENKTAKMVLTACDISPKSLKEINFTAGKFNIAVRTLPCTMEELRRVTGKTVGIFAITDNGFLNMIASQLETFENENTTKN